MTMIALLMGQLTVFLVAGIIAGPQGVQESNGPYIGMLFLILASYYFSLGFK